MERIEEEIRILKLEESALGSVGVGGRFVNVGSGVEEEEGEDSEDGDLREAVEELEGVTASVSFNLGSDNHTLAAGEIYAEQFKKRQRMQMQREKQREKQQQVEEAQMQEKQKQSQKQLQQQQQKRAIPPAKRGGDKRSPLFQRKTSEVVEEKEGREETVVAVRSPASPSQEEDPGEGGMIKALGGDDSGLDTSIAGGDFLAGIYYSSPPTVKKKRGDEVEMDTPGWVGTDDEGSEDEEEIRRVREKREELAREKEMLLREEEELRRAKEEKARAEEARAEEARAERAREEEARARSQASLSQQQRLRSSSRGRQQHRGSGNPHRVTSPSSGEEGMMMGGNMPSPPSDNAGRKKATERPKVLKEEDSWDEIKIGGEPTPNAKPQQQVKGTTSTKTSFQTPVKRPVKSPVTETSGSASGSSSSASSSGSSSGEWYYEDKNSTIQGPFPTSTMTSWVNAGYLPMSLKVAEGPQSVKKGEWKNMAEVWNNGELNRSVFEEGVKGMSPIKRRDFG
jgi:hypothetical protein